MRVQVRYQSLDIRVYLLVRCKIIGSVTRFYGMLLTQGILLLLSSLTTFRTADFSLDGRIGGYINHSFIRVSHWG